jgi:hypothetical protein
MPPAFAARGNSRLGAGPDSVARRIESFRMAENPVELYNLQYRRLFPWLHLTRAFWIAVDIRKLILAAVALMLVSAGFLVCDQLPFGQSNAPGEAREIRIWPWDDAPSLGYDLGIGSDGSSELRRAIHDPRQTLWRITSNWQVVLLPFRRLVEPAAILFRGDATAAQLADAATRTLWGLIVWSIFGGAISRMAAMQFARDQQIGIRQALVFSASRFPGYLSAPLMPLAGVAILWALCVLGGWIGRIPGGVGEGLLGILWGLELVFGFLMAVVLIGMAVGWPLMFATISVEGTDGFDGLSRAYNYVFERPLYLLWQTVVVMCYGTIMIYFVWLMSQILMQLAVWGVSWGLGYEATAGLIAGSPEFVLGSELRTTTPSTAWGAQIARGWMCLLAVFVLGFIHTFFWSSATIVYFVLRHSVDANDFDEVYVEEAEERDELLPLVGTAAIGETEKNLASAAGPSGAAPVPSPPLPPVDLAP